MLRPPALSKRLRDLAEALLSIARELETSEAEPPPKPRRLIVAEAIADAAAQIAAGELEGVAIARAASRRALNSYSLWRAWEITRKMEAARDLYARRYMARQLMAYGIDRQTVAEIVGCHPNHIPRMVQALER